MVSIYANDLTGVTVAELLDLCRRCRPEDLDGREFKQRKQDTLARAKAELAKRDPHELADLLTETLTSAQDVLS